jgi:aspartyl-tRNA(Asn)/glutamyl-tRNA(Gln) amidotransferase subunit A
MINAQFSHTEFMNLSTDEKLAALRNGKISVYDHTQALLNAIRTDSHNIFLHLNPDALEQAKYVDAKIRAGTAGKLAGLCLAIKSNICVDGMITNCASKTLANYKATYDADVVRRILDADGIILGMVNMDEFACGGSGETSAFGPTDNPAAPGYITGGSSSGSAAAIAAKLCDLSLGSDTGGSIRNPASHCGIVGIKPTYGRVSRFGLIDLSMSLDQIGPFAPDVFGASLLLEVISGLSQNDASTCDEQVGNYSQFKNGTYKVGVSADFEKLCVDRRIYDLILSCVSHLPLQNVALSDIDLSIQTYYPLVYVELFSGSRKFDGRRYGLKIEESCGDEVLRRILGGREISKAEHNGKYYRTALAVKDAIAASIHEALLHVDVLVLPTTPILPHKFGTELSVEAMYAYDAYTIPANLAGICAGVIPAGTIDGIPVGLQVYAKQFDEAVLCDFMQQLETRKMKREM